MHSAVILKRGVAIDLATRVLLTLMIVGEGWLSPLSLGLSGGNEDILIDEVLECGQVLLSGTICPQKILYVVW